MKTTYMDCPAYSYEFNNNKYLIYKAWGAWYIEEINNKIDKKDKLQEFATKKAAVLMAEFLLKDK